LQTLIMSMENLNAEKISTTDSENADKVSISKIFHHMTPLTSFRNLRR
jgi:hypothetical protein